MGINYSKFNPLEFMKMHKIKFLFVVSGLLFFSYLSAKQGSRERICEQIVKELLEVEEAVEISKLPGGLSGAELFLAHFKDKNYVIRFLTQSSLEERQREILACTIGSENEYGAKVYLSDVEQGFIVMEHLTNDLQEDEECVALAKLAKRIHSGPHFSYSRSIFDQVDSEIDEYLNTQKARIEFIGSDWLEKIDRALSEIRQAVKCYSHTAPCHRDLHPQNLFFSKGQFLAIDYEMAAQDDPFVDLAMIVLSYHLNLSKEKLFLASYFGREPSVQEESKFFLMKQVVRIFWGFRLIKLVPDDAEELLQPLASREAKQPSYTTPDGQLTNASIFLRDAFSDFDSKEYSQALKTLLKKSITGLKG